MQLNLAAAHRREKSDFVARVEYRVPRSKFLIARSHDRRAIPGEFRSAGNIHRKELFDGHGVREAEGFLGVPDNIFQTAEKQDLHTHSLGDRGHSKIVTRAKETCEGTTKHFAFSAREYALSNSIP
jgi:hypothetical protein